MSALKLFLSNSDHTDWASTCLSLAHSSQCLFSSALYLSTVWGWGRGLAQLVERGMNHAWTALIPGTTHWLFLHLTSGSGRGRHLTWGLRRSGPPSQSLCPSAAAAASAALVCGSLQLTGHERLSPQLVPSM